MDTSAFRWGVNRYYALLLLHDCDNDHSCVMVAVSSFDAYITIFQARIKKIMQADEDVGKIALAVPVLVCKSSCYH